MQKVVGSNPISRLQVDELTDTWVTLFVRDGDRVSEPFVKYLLIAPS